MTTSSLSREALIDRLQRLWQNGQQPDLLAFLQQAGVSSPELIASLCAVDQWQRWHLGQRVPAEDYLRRCTALLNDSDAALEIIYGEFLVRQSLGEAPQQSEYFQRFPRFADALRQQFALFQALEKGGQPVSARPQTAKGLAQQILQGPETTEMCTTGGDQPNAASAAGQQKESWTFLAPPQQIDEMGRLGSYRVLKVLGK